MELCTERLSDLIKWHGKAFYLLDSEQFEENYHSLKKAFSDIYSNFNIAYSYKTNYMPKLCKIVNRNGGYAEVVSEMEMQLAMSVGVCPEKIIWNGPIKDIKTVNYLLNMGGTVNIDCLYELNEIVKEIGGYSTNKLNVGIRCNFDIGDGVISRFGIDVNSDEFDATLNLIKNTPYLHLVNLHCHFADRNLEYWSARAEGMMQLVQRATEILGYMPDRVDLGGGLYGNMDESLKEQFKNTIPEYSDYARETASIVKKYFHEAGPELLIEPGSALVGDCMKFVCCVENVKQVRGKNFAAVMGSQKNISMSGVNPPMQIFKTGKSGTLCEDIDIVGYTCIEGDVLYRNYKGDIAVGDIVVFGNCGSYSVVMKPPFIMPNFPVLDVCGEYVEVIKMAETFEDVFSTYPKMVS